MASTEAFEKAYKTLNTAQQKAVDTVEGPVLVIAGPGTGKTHILTLRVANILRQTQATPSNILVLTFTDSAARTVRRRLAELIGDTTARDIAVFTFHSFCDYILKTYPDFFPAWEGKRLAGDVEATLLWREVLEREDVVHLRTPKSPYFYLRDLEGLYKDLIRERVSGDAYRAWAKEEEERIRADESNYYSRDSKYGKKGEFKAEGEKKLARLEKVYEAALLFEVYERLKDERDVYDFSDVLRGVVDALETDPALRATLQEQFQYILADEHQDANAYQHALLDAFAYDEHPNLFVVGDEKQAIFRFQGADATHFREFLTRYPRTTLISLTESFRSRTEILDAAHMVAGTHIPASYGEHTPLTATRSEKGSLELVAAPDPLAERDMISSLIEEAIAKGTSPDDIAVIAARNATVNQFAEHLAGRGIPTLRAGEISLTSRPLMRAILASMRAVGNPLDTGALRESLLAPWWDAGLEERALLLARTRDQDLMGALHEQFPKIWESISGLQKRVTAEAPLQLFSRLLEESGARNYLLSHAENLEDIALVRKVYGYLEEVVARDHGVSFGDAVEALDKAREHGLEWVKSQLLSQEGRVTVITAHKVKGMEFSKVFIVSLTDTEWERGRQAARIPSPVDMRKTADDAAKQFYVALTRAKDSLTFSYAQESLEGREKKPSIFIPSGIPIVSPTFDALPRLHSDVDVSDLVCSLTRAYLSGEGLSPSALQEYLDSPPTFFARRVLRLKEPEQARMVIGTAVHAGIATYLETSDQDAAQRALEAALRRSLLPRSSAYEHACEDARQRLGAYLREASSLGTPRAVEKTYRLGRTVLGEEVQLSGKIDALLERDGQARIVDFKTSTTVRGQEENYVLQLAFYDYLLRENGEAPSGTSIVQVRNDGIEEFPIILTDVMKKDFHATLESVIPELLSGTWRQGTEASAYDDILRLFDT